MPHPKLRRTACLTPHTSRHPLAPHAPSCFSLSSFVAVVVDVTHAVCWRGIGDGNAVFVVPAIFFAIELSQAVLFLGTSLTDWEFWVLFLLQKTYSIMRNSGITTWFQYEIRNLFKKGPR